MLRLVLIVLMLFVQSALAATSGMQQPITSLSEELGTGGVQPPASIDPSLDALGSLQLPLADWAQIRDRIRARAAMCDSCHATALHQGNDYLPVLQGQNREYLYLKIKSFAEDSRSRHPFPRVSRSLKPQEMVDLSLYYALQDSRLKLDHVRLATRWQEELQIVESQLSACRECHGQDGNGGGGIPDLSGQNRGYLSYRIRENASRSTPALGQSDESLRCKIEPVSIEQSRHLAAVFGLVIDRQRALRGAAIFEQNCSLCHDSHEDVLDLYRLAGWLEQPLQGAEPLIRGTTIRHEDGGPKQRLSDMDRHQWRDVMHYLIDRIGLN